MRHSFRASAYGNATNAGANLVHAARGSDVVMVMVDSRVVVTEGRLADTRWEGLNARARQVGLDLLELGR